MYFVHLSFLSFFSGDQFETCSNTFLILPNGILVPSWFKAVYPFVQMWLLLKSITISDKCKSLPYIQHHSQIEIAQFCWSALHCVSTDSISDKGTSNSPVIFLISLMPICTPTTGSYPALFTILVKNHVLPTGISTE